MLVKLRNPSRLVELRGPISVVKVLKELDLARESVLVIRNGTLVPGDAMLTDEDEIEIRPVISGGAAELLPQEPGAAELLPQEPGAAELLPQEPAAAERLPRRNDR